MQKEEEYDETLIRYMTLGPSASLNNMEPCERIYDCIKSMGKVRGRERKDKGKREEGDGKEKGKRGEGEEKFNEAYMTLGLNTHP
jgi:hypothetical protein